MFKMIRCGSEFELVIMVSPPEAGPDTPDAKYCRYATWQIGDHKPGAFNEISRGLAISYFSGIADGIGFETPPADIFPSLEDALMYITKNGKSELEREQLRKKIMKKLKDFGIPVTVVKDK